MEKSLQLLGRLFIKKKKNKEHCETADFWDSSKSPCQDGGARACRCHMRQVWLQCCVLLLSHGAGGTGKPRWRRNGRREGSARRAAVPRVATATARGPAMAEEGSREGKAGRSSLRGHAPEADGASPEACCCLRDSAGLGAGSEGPRVGWRRGAVPALRQGKVIRAAGGTGAYF